MPANTPDIVTHACELFAPLGTIRTKRMFGGWGFYVDDLFFALVARDTLYLKADGDSEARFAEAGSERFTYTREDAKTYSMGYWMAPEAALESPHAMAPWARLAVDCALRNRNPARKKKTARV